MGNYLSVAEFESYELGVASDLSNTAVEKYIGIAENLVNGYILRPKGLHNQTITAEKHEFNTKSTRVYPYVTPVTSVASYVVRIAANNTWTYGLGGVYINNDEGFVEATEVSGVSQQISSLLLQNSLYKAITELTYTAGYTTIPEDIKSATALQVNDLISQRHWAAQGLQAVKNAKLGAQSLEKSPHLDDINPMAKILLSKYRAISLR